jgi:hypothetical protein
MLVLLPKLFLAFECPVAVRRAFEEVAPVDPDGLVGKRDRSTRV